MYAFFFFSQQSPRYAYSKGTITSTRARQFPIDEGMELNLPLDGGKMSKKKKKNKKYIDI